MGFVHKLKALFSAGPRSGADPYSHYYYVRCRRCREIVKARINLRNDLSAEFEGDSDSSSGYIYRKVIVGRGRCFQQIEVTMHFDGQRHIASQEIMGGEFVSEEEYGQQSQGQNP